MLLFDLIDSFRFSRKILGMNARNISYIKPFNRKKGIKLVDNKIRLKKALQKNDIGTPKLLASVRTYDRLTNFDFSKLPSSFVLKPNAGFGGDGIIVIFGERKKKNEQGERVWIKGNNEKISESDIRNHVRNILDGAFSRTNSPDIAFFEERIKITKLFKTISYKGIPDIRVIIFNKIPAMAMLRLPTRESAGKANLHQGGIGMGIDIATGVTTNAIMHDRIIDYAPGTRTLLSGIRIPKWDEILKTAIDAADITGLGYTGIDIAIDRDQGPLVLEANARPGLSIQIANLAPLKERLEKIKGLKVKTAKRGIRVAQDLFGGEIEEEVEEITGKQVIGLVEKVKLYGINGKTIEVEAKIDTGADSSSIDRQLAIDLGYEGVFQEFEDLGIDETVPYSQLNLLSDKINRKLKKDEARMLRKVVIVKAGNGHTIRPYIKVEFAMDTRKQTSNFSIIDRSHLNYNVLIGSKDLKFFLIDSTK